MAAEATQPTTDPEALMARVQELEDALGETADPATLAVADELVAALVALYGDGLRRVMEALAAAGPAGEGVRAALMDDGVVASLLLVHDLYPVDLETRVREALATVRPYMESHGGDVELLGVEDGVARLRLEGSCSGCRASSATLELAIKQALDEHAPDLAGFEAEGAVEDAAPAAPAPVGLDLPMAGDGPPLPVAGDARTAALDRVSNGGFELPVMSSPAPVAPAGPAWVSVDGIEGLPDGSLTAVQVEGEAIVVGSVGGALLAYANACAGCGGPLEGGRLEGGILDCPGCGLRFDLPAAGRAAGGEDLQLRPVPLLSDGAGTRVAVAR
jgi:Fe-S cluster biogenesis protein NfuA/nitrite reductase/ring-hydroxylating ferredoxin subunit